MQKALPRKKVVERVWFSKDVKEDILRKSDGVCAHCGCPVAIGDNFTVEHVVPISKGGTNDLVNIVALCQTCNTTKGDCIWHPYEYLTYLHDENKKELGEYIDKYFHDKRWFTRNNFCQVDFKKIEVNIPFAGKQKTLRRGDQTLLARRCMTVNYKLQKALYYDLQDIYDMQIAYMKRNKLKVDKAAIKETISNAFLNGAIYYVARSDGTKVGSFAVRMEERHIAIGHCRYTTPILVYSNIITASSLQYVNLVNFETTPYRIPDESKKQEVIQYIKSSALNFDDTDMALLQKSNIHEILYKVLGNWDRYHIDEEDVADFVGLDNCKTYCNCKFEEAYNVK